MIPVETDVAGEWGEAVDWAALARGAVHAAVAQSRHPSLAENEVSVKYASDDEVRALNARWRGQDKATNVLSFPMAREAELADAPLLGDIVLAHGVCTAEAEAKGVPVETHAAHLLVHGTLHLLGYGHETDADAEEMEETERRALAALGIADPYHVTEVQP